MTCLINESAISLAATLTAYHATDTAAPSATVTNGVSVY